MKILWITWKDVGHPDAGGAEIVADELCSRLIRDGHSVTMLTAKYPDMKKQSATKGVEVIRVGDSRYTHSAAALLYYVRHLRNKFDIVIEEVNGAAPYFAVFFGRKAKRYTFYHQLGRINWLYEIPAPFSYVGYYVLVPFATRLASMAGTRLITVSESSRRSLEQYGFSEDRTSIISEGLQMQPVEDLRSIHKFKKPTVLSHGSMRAMKRTIDQIKAFELAKKDIPDLQLKVSGSSSGSYGKQVLAYINKSPYKQDIEYLGRTTEAQKIDLMQRCHAILVTSIEEGWGLIVTEANSQGTPAVVYDVAGLRDSVQSMKTGIVTAPNPAGLASGIVAILKDEKAYKAMQAAGWEWSKHITFDQSYEDFKQALDIA